MSSSEDPGSHHDPSSHHDAGGYDAGQSGYPNEPGYGQQPGYPQQGYQQSPDMGYDPYNPGMGNPGMGNPGMGNPGMGNPGMGNPAMMPAAMPVAAAVCQSCGTQNPPGAVACVTCQAPLMYAMRPQKDKVVAGLLALFLGQFGVHKFYLGYNAAGGIMLALWLTGFCMIFFFLLGLIWVWVPGLIGFIEAIIYLTKSDYDFQQTYVLNKREWF